MKRVSNSNKIVYEPDFAILKDGDTYWFKNWESVSRETRKKVLRDVRYGPSVYGTRPLLKRVFDNTKMIVDLTHDRSPEYFMRLEGLLRELEEKRGLKLNPISGFAADKMGGKRYPVYFVAPIIVMEEWAKEVGIHKNLYVDMPAVKRIEREKKFLGNWTIFAVRPRVKFIDNIPGYDGMAFCNPEWREKNNLPNGFKMTGPAKDTVHDFKGIMDWKDVDLVVQEGGNKLKLDADKFAELAGYDHTLFPELRYSRLLKTNTKSGKIILGRYPNYGMDLQATLGIKPRIDLEIVTKLINWKLDDEIKEAFFMYNDAKKGMLLTNLGKDVFENKLTMTNSYIRESVYNMAYRHIQWKFRMAVEGEFAQAAPLSFIPDYARCYIQKYIIVGYSGGIVASGKAAVWENIAYIDDELWLAMGRDYDGDIAFLFPADRFAGVQVISDAVCIRKNYILPNKVDGVPDTRDDIKALIDRIDQGRLIGQAYNTGKIFVDICRYAGMSKREVTDIEIKLMARVETHLYALKRNVIEDDTFTLKELQKEFNVYVKGSRVVVDMFRALKANGPITIDKKEYNPLEALVIRANEADPNSKSWYEQAVACCKPLCSVVKSRYYYEMQAEEYPEELVNEYPE